MQIKFIALILVILLSSHVVSYGQHELQDYIRFAKDNSPLIKDNKNQTIIANYEIEHLKAIFTKAQIGVSGGYLLAPIISDDNNRLKLEVNSGGANKYYGFDLSQTNGGLYQGLISYNQPLFGSKRYEIAANQVEISKQINDNNTRLTEHDIEKVVTDQYILCLLDKKQWQLADTMRILLNEQTILIKKLVDASILKQTDLTLLNIEFQNDLALLASFKSIYKRDLMGLNLISGITDTAWIDLNDISLSLNPYTANSAFVEKYRFDSLNLEAGQQIFELKYKPQINFFSTAGLDAVYAPTILNRFGVSAGLTFNWNFYDGHQKSITRRKSETQIQTLSFYKNNFLLQNSIRLKSIKDEYESYVEREAIAEKQIQEYKDLLNAYKREIVQGTLSVINYIMVIKSMATLQRDYTILKTNQQLLLSAYNYWNW